jgi:hypothetical protein
MHARKFLFLCLPVLVMLMLTMGTPAALRVAAQQPTGSIPTVTGTPTGPTVSVDPSLGMVDVYAGPSTYKYPKVGVLLTGSKTPALGRARGDQNWIMVQYVGVPGSVAWVYALYVSLNGAGGQGLPLVDIPPTPTPLFTPTIDPTLVAAYLPAQHATPLPTFTAPAPLAVPTFVQPQQTSRIPIGLLIFGFAVVGVLGTMISFLRGR